MFAVLRHPSANNAAALRYADKAKPHLSCNPKQTEPRLSETVICIASTEAAKLVPGSEGKGDSVEEKAYGSCCEREGLVVEGALDVSEPRVARRSCSFSARIWERSRSMAASLKANSFAKRSCSLFAN